MMSVDHADHLTSLYCFPLGGWAMNPGLTLGTVSPSFGGNRAFVTSIAGPLPHFRKTRSKGQHVNLPPSGEHSYCVMANREHGVDSSLAEDMAIGDEWGEDEDSAGVENGWIAALGREAQGGGRDSRGSQLIPLLLP